MGGPGSGKTAVCCELVWPTGNTRAASLSPRLLAYYFCQAHDVETLSVANFIRGLAEQVCQSVFDVKVCLDNAFVLVK
jgi:ankyrin repeat domain-containing protein 50